MKTIKLTIIAMALSLCNVMAQQASIPNVLKLRSARQSGEIIEKNKLVGYYVFFTKEKADKKNTAYEVALFDDNYNETKTFEIVRPKNTILMEMVYNGEVFMLHFYDRKTGYEFVTYDRSGTKKGSSIIPEDNISKYELQRMQMNMQNNAENVTIYPYGNSGFIRSTFLKNKKLGYEIVAYDNNAKELWSYGSDEESKMLETIEIVDVSENIISGTVTKKKGAMTKEMDMYCLLINPKTGKLIEEMQLGSDEAGRKSLLKSFINEKSGNIILVGEFYKPKDDYLKDKSFGLYLMELGLDGKEISYKEYKWKGQIDKFKQENIDAEDMKDDKRPFYVFFHDVIVSDNGHIFLIGEQFIKQVSAGAIAGKIATAALGGSSNASNFEIRVANMVVIEFDEKKDMIDFDLIQKKKTNVILPAGFGFYGTAFLGYYINSIGAFDYSFTSRDKEKDNFDVVYIDYNRKEEEQSKKSDMMIGVISINKGVKANNRVPINTDAKFWWIQPGKPGFISVGEYYRKEKRIDYRLEPLSY